MPEVVTAQPGGPLAAAVLALGIAAVLLLPGLPVALVGRRRGPADGLEVLALAVAASLAAWPILILWTDTLLPGIAWGRASASLVLVVGLGLALARIAVRKGVSPNGAPETAPTESNARHRAWILMAGLGVVGMAVVGRTLQAQGVLVPLWVDGLHHTEIVQLFLQRGGLPDDLQPYMPVERFYYHYGFHAVAAAAAWLTGANAAAAVLWTGQALSALAALTIYPLAVLATRRRAAALAAMAVPASLYWFPQYFVTWSRFTQLTGMVVLPVAWWALHRALTVPGPSVPRWPGPKRAEPPRPRLDAASEAGAAVTTATPALDREVPRTRWLVAQPPAAGALTLAVWLGAAMPLIHYRVAAVYAVGAAVLAVGTLAGSGGGPSRIDSVRRLAVVVALAAGLAAPWLLGRFIPGALALRTATAGLTPAEQAGGFLEGPAGVEDLPRWLFDTRWNDELLVLAAVGIAVAALRGRWGAWGLLGGAAALAALAHPTWAGLARSWTLPPFALAIGLYIPVALGVAWLVGALLEALGRGSRAARDLVARELAARDLAARDFVARDLVARDLAAAAVIGATMVATGIGLVDGDYVAQRSRGILDAVVEPLRLESESADRSSGGDATPDAGAAADGAEPVGRSTILGLPVEDVITPITRLVTEDDLALARYMQREVRPDVPILIGATHWHLGTYRGVDGGYWLPFLTGHMVTLPAGLYPYGPVEQVREIAAIAAQAAKGPDLTEADLDTLLAATGANYVYVGPTGADVGWTLERLTAHPHLTLMHRVGDAGILVVAREDPPEPTRPTPSPPGRPGGQIGE